MRGKDKEEEMCDAEYRITPAYAGKSFMSFIDTLSGKGSPPPMRGKAKPDRSKQIQARITPAYAGKRFSRPHRGHEMRDHPRLCGEKFS